MKISTQTYLHRSIKGIVVFTFLLLSFTTSAFAIDLKTALSKGLAGEVDSGYLAIPPGASGEARPLVSSVNSERRAAYVSLGQKNGVTTEIAGKATFEKRYPGFPPGTWVQIQGRWTQK
ncbi:MAG: YdbL family protein [Chlorobium phaeobacteroides]|uniref:DUF1318 domain-containing protein n=1 Tax=Chlorobium phaeobacteroides (strain BS1) TaxID=331678 RepID=B3EJM8_CHLPB|nr:YdbL family protein [Chlorobium phaeobacteroides]NEX14264.1 DUF1318 domain-containing protein [Prosthecochloris sp.]